MKHGEMNTLESIINAAKTMTMPKEKPPFFRRTAIESPSVSLKTENVSELFSEEHKTEHSEQSGQISSQKDLSVAPPSEQMHPESPDSSDRVPEQYSQTETIEQQTLLLEQSHQNPDINTVGVHFLEFAVAFLTLSKCQYQHSSNLKVSSLPFFALVALDNWADEDYTMSELAEKLQVTKQQLSKMINVLEEKGLVERIHDKTNRRRVYIRICEPGRKMMTRLKQEMLESTLLGLRSYTPAELSDMDSCICRLTELMGKFNTDPI